MLGVLLLVLAALGAAIGYYLYEGRSREVTGSSTEEFLPEDNPADETTTTVPPTTTAPTPTPSAALEAQWPTYGRDPARTHVSPAKHRPPYRRLWMHRARHYIEFPPAVAYDKVFVAQQRGLFFALDAETGKQRWTKSFRRCAAASPTVWRGVVYQAYMHELPCRKHQAGATGLLIAMNARTGRELWSFRPGAIESSPLVVDGVIYFGSWDRHVYALDVKTRKVRWRFRTDDRVVAAPAYSRGTIYAATSGGRLYAIDARTGRYRWRAASFSRFGRREYFYATPTVAYGRVYIGNTDGYVYSYGARSGKLIWAQRAGTYVYTAAAVWQRTVYVGTWDGYVVAFDAATGRTRWRHDAPGGVSGAPTVMGGLLYFSTLGRFAQGVHQRRVEPGRNETFALDARTGKRVWSFPDGAYSPIVADRDRVYLVGRTRIYGLEGETRAGQDDEVHQEKPPPCNAVASREMQRHAPTAIVLVLLTVTAVAFVTTQRQKLEPSPVGRIAIDPFLSAVCACDKATATVRIGLKRTDTVTLDIVSSDGDRVRTLVDGRRYRARSPVVAAWDGRDDRGRVVADGSYQPRLKLESGARSFVLPNPIVLDTRAPLLTVTSVRPRVFSPDGDGRNDRVVVRYTVDEPAHGILRVDGLRHVYTRFRPLEGTLAWNGKLRGRFLRAGVHRLVAAAEDEAGNVGTAGRDHLVTIRYVEIGRTRLSVLARTRFGVRVTTDASSVRWRFAGRTGVGRSGLLVLRAPRAGRYTLFVEANGHGARARVVVRPRQRVGRRAPAARRQAITTPASGQTR